MCDVDGIVRYVSSAIFAAEGVPLARSIGDASGEGAWAGFAMLYAYRLLDAGAHPASVRALLRPMEVRP